MGFNTAVDKFWMVTIWLVCLAIIGGVIWWAIATRTPDMPFYAWLAESSRDDVAWKLMAIVASGTIIGNMVNRK